jgi:hypothetical protein
MAHHLVLDRLDLDDARHRNLLAEIELKSG